jgi:hypothetical protein
VAADPQAMVGFPAIPGATYTGLKTTIYRLNYGPDFYKTGIMTINPPVVAAPMFNNPRNGLMYTTYVPKTDADGNDVAGIRLPGVTVPLATYTGWGVRVSPHANDGCEGVGQVIPFAKSRAERTRSGDPRLSIEERYPTLAGYSAKVKAAVEDLVVRRFLLREDAQEQLDRLIKAGEASGVGSGASSRH